MSEIECKVIVEGSEIGSAPALAGFVERAVVDALYEADEPGAVIVEFAAGDGRRMRFQNGMGAWEVKA